MLASVIQVAANGRRCSVIFSSEHSLKSERALADLGSLAATGRVLHLLDESEEAKLLESIRSIALL